MTDLNRRDFLAATSLGFVGGAAALGGLTQSAQAGSHGGSDTHHAALAALFPGSVNSDGEYTLPELPYSYDAVSDVIDEQTMMLHHSRHHQGYVNGLIAAESALADARESGNFSLADYHTGKTAFHGAGHFLHCVFWDCIGPDEGSGDGMGGEPDGKLAEMIERDFGSFKKMLDQFAAVSRTVEGSGWGIVAYSLAAGKLVIHQAQNHELNAPWATVPLFCNDVWEHAYYLKYQNNRAAYVEAFPKILNWKRIAKRFEMLAG
ncbi:MAG: superoxide dismutase [Candidatus Sumerlaeia bacterium]|nr:superoxide dismutase [Candidatus Sumerlaeia bacterium]